MGVSLLSAALLLPLSSDASAAPSLPQGGGFTHLYPSSQGVVTDGTNEGNGSIISPVVAGKHYYFRFFNPSGVSYYNRLRIVSYGVYPSAGTTGGTVIVNSTTAVTRDGDYLEYDFDAPNGSNYVLIMLWAYANNLDLAERNYNIINPELFYDLDIRYYFNPPSGFYSGDTIGVTVTNSNSDKTFFEIGYRPIGETAIEWVYTSGGNSFSTSADIVAPASGSYDLLIRCSTAVQGITIAVPFSVLVAPPPSIPDDVSLPVDVNVSDLPDLEISLTSDDISVITSIWDIIPPEIAGMLGLTVAALFIGWWIKK